MFYSEERQYAKRKCKTCRLISFSAPKKRMQGNVIHEEDGWWLCGQGSFPLPLSHYLSLVFFTVLDSTCQFSCLLSLRACRLLGHVGDSHLWSFPSLNPRVQQNTSEILVEVTWGHLGHEQSSNLPKVIQLGNEKLSGKPAFVSLGLPGKEEWSGPTALLTMCAS